MSIEATGVKRWKAHDNNDDDDDNNDDDDDNNNNDTYTYTYSNNNLYFMRVQQNSNRHRIYPLKVENLFP